MITSVVIEKQFRVRMYSETMATLCTARGYVVGFKILRFRYG